RGGPRSQARRRNDAHDPGPARAVDRADHRLRGLRPRRHHAASSTLGIRIAHAYIGTCRWDDAEVARIGHGTETRRGRARTHSEPGREAATEKRRATTTMIPDDVIAQIRDKADIVAVIGQHVQLKKAGRNFKGLCPFHGEKTPSFSVSPDK